jgi:hypothetical protein
MKFLAACLLGTKIYELVGGSKEIHLKAQFQKLKFVQSHKIDRLVSTKVIIAPVPLITLLSLSWKLIC